ncbi:hypothetical protein, partial [Shewanella marina]|uniref:hypothetical protein n=1 Tax=Shewanella marina TaxID=487319 RepID=UPI00056B69C0
ALSKDKGFFVYKICRQKGLFSWLLFIRDADLSRRGRVRLIQDHVLRQLHRSLISNDEAFLYV